MRVTLLHCFRLLLETQIFLGGGFMRFLKLLGILLLVSGAIAVASENKMGIHEESRITFDTPVRVGGDVLPRVST